MYAAGVVGEPGIKIYEAVAGSGAYMVEVEGFVGVARNFFVLANITAGGAGASDREDYSGSKIYFAQRD